MTKSRIVGLLIVLGVGFLVFGPEEDPSDSHDRGGDPESTTDRQFQPREPAFLERGRDYGIAGSPRTQQEAPPSYGRPSPYTPEPYPQSHSEGYGAPGPYGGQAPLSANGYRFRPLDAKEQRRTEAAQYPEQYPTPYHPAPAAQRRPDTPSPYSATPAYPSPQQEIYSFRPLEKTRASRGRWEGPYQQPGWRDNRAPIDPWTAPPDPQWGSTPPAQRMYPSFYRDSSTRVTAR